MIAGQAGLESVPVAPTYRRHPSTVIFCHRHCQSPVLVWDEGIERYFAVFDCSFLFS
jgi:hypothetical protein